MKFIGKFDPLKNERVQIMDKDGKIIDPKLMPKISNEEILKAYKIMNLSRRQDAYQERQQRQGRLLSFLTSTGQEAAEVAYTMILDPKKDYFLSGYRNNAAWLTMGQPIRNIMLY
jgi:pyruvate dehydrogenase E1 component alpha subunit